VPAMINAFDDTDRRRSGYAQRRDAMNDQYQFHIEGHLDHTWSVWLGGVLMQPQPDGTTLFTQVLADQSALYGLLLKLSNVGVSLIAVQRMTDEKTCLPH
jgi:hypothetical protein